MIKILYLGHTTDKINYNHWYGFDFMRKVNTLPNVQVKFYGQNLHNFYPDIIVKKYCFKDTLKSLSQIYDFNIIICSNLNRMKFNRKLLIPSDFKSYNCPKIAIEGDYHQHYKKEIKYISGIDLMLHRHLSTYRLAIKTLPNINHILFPCSVDTNIFYPQKFKRINKIAFIGNYYYRDKEAFEILKNKNLLGFKGKKIEWEYLNYLQNYTVYFNHSGKYNIDNAKAFEIIASGGILFTNKCDNGFEYLFGKNVFLTYDFDHNDLILKAENIFKDVNFQKHLIKNGLKIIKEKHTHEIRAQELLDIITKKFKISYGNRENSLISQITNFFSRSPKTTTKPHDEYPLLIIEGDTVIPPKHLKSNKNTAEINMNLITQLYNKNIKICLLTNTCREVMLNGEIGEFLSIAVDDKTSAKKILGDEFVLGDFPKKTKGFVFEEKMLYVPYPILDYLKQECGDNIVNELKAKEKVLRLMGDLYKFCPRSKRRR